MLNVLEAAAVVVLALALLVVQVAISARVWRENAPLMATLKIAGVSVLVYIAWYMVAAIAAILLGFFSPAARGVEVDFYYATLGALIYPCDALPALNQATGGAMCNLPGYAVGVPVLFVVGMLGALILNRLGRRPNHSGNPDAQASG